MSKWKEVTLKNITSLISRGVTPKYSDDGFQVLNQKCIRNFSIDYSKSRKTCDNKNYREDKFLEMGDVLINSTGTGTLGRVAIFDKKYNNILVDTHVTVVRAKDNISPFYLGYYLHLIEDTLVLLGRGATNQQELNKGVLEKLKIKIPDLETQEKIGQVLSSYDELIENNNRRIELLENMAEEIYKEWFVRMRFPGHEEVSFEKGIPEGWEVKRVKDVVDRLKAGHYYKEHEVSEVGDTIVIDQSEKTFLGFHSNDPDHIADIDSPIILFGDHSCKMNLMIRNFSVSENVVPFKSVEKNNEIFLFYATKRLVETQEYKRHWTEFTNKKIFIPSDILKSKFINNVRDIIIQVEKYKEQNQNLIKQRDMLLPRLMNGTIEVK